jgi:preprotein translocase subunit YajC
MTVFNLILQSASNPIVGFLPLQKQRRNQQTMLKNLQNGNTVVTSGGIVGTIVTINNDDTLILRVKPDNIKLQVSRSSVSALVQEEKKG